MSQRRNSNLINMNSFKKTSNPLRVTGLGRSAQRPSVNKRFISPNMRISNSHYRDSLKKNSSLQNSGQKITHVSRQPYLKSRYGKNYGSEMKPLVSDSYGLNFSSMNNTQTNFRSSKPIVSRVGNYSMSTPCLLYTSPSPRDRG